jgi:hypothetical protein
MSIPISGLSGTSFDGRIGIGDKLKAKCGIFCPVELRRCTFEDS